MASSILKKRSPVLDILCLYAGSFFTVYDYLWVEGLFVAEVVNGVSEFWSRSTRWEEEGLDCGNGRGVDSESDCLWVANEIRPLLVLWFVLENG